MSELPIWATEFHPFTWMHGLTLIWTIGSIVASCVLGRRWIAQGGVGELKELKLASAWAGFAIGVNLWSIVYWQLPANFTLKESLPIQLCDIACLLAPLVFLTEWRLPRALLFFWGIGLSSQAFVTPTLREGPEDMKFYLFWLVHLCIVGSAVYDVAVRRFRPTVRDLLFTIAASILYLLSMIAVNHFLKSNYGFVGGQLRDRPTLVDKLGPWPQRVLTMTAIAIGGFCIMWLISGIVDRAMGGADRRQAK